MAASPWLRHVQEFISRSPTPAGSPVGLTLTLTLSPAAAPATAPAAPRARAWQPAAVPASAPGPGSKGVAAGPARFPEEAWGAGACTDGCPPAAGAAAAAAVTAPGPCHGDAYEDGREAEAAQTRAEPRQLFPPEHCEAEGEGRPAQGAPAMSCSSSALDRACSQGPEGVHAAARARRGAIDLHPAQGDAPNLDAGRGSQPATPTLLAPAGHGGTGGSSWAPGASGGGRPSRPAAGWGGAASAHAAAAAPVAAPAEDDAPSAEGGNARGAPAEAASAGKRPAAPAGLGAPAAAQEGAWSIPAIGGRTSGAPGSGGAAPSADVCHVPAVLGSAAGLACVAAQATAFHALPSCTCARRSADARGPSVSVLCGAESACLWAAATRGRPQRRTSHAQPTITAVCSSRRRCA